MLTLVRLADGDGVPALLLPGFCGDHREIAPLAPHLGRPVLAADLAGSPALTALHLASALADAGIDRVHLVAASYGGLSSGGLPSASLASFAPIGMLPSRASLGAGPGWMARVARLVPDAALGRWYAARLRSSLREDGVPPDVAAAIVSAPRDVAVLRDRIRALAAWEVPRLHHVPTLWIQGTDDPFVRWTDADIRAACSWAAIAQVPGRHRPHASHPEAMSHVLTSFWADVGD